jgi:hypothetical protein
LVGVVPGWEAGTVPDPSTDEDITAVDPSTGAALVNLDFLGTGTFTALAILGVVAPDALGVAAAAWSCALFAVGCTAFLWAYAIAVSRSREDLIDIPGLFFLSKSAPTVVRFRFRLAFAVQVAVAIATASIRPYTVAAFGILVPVFGLGLMGLWGARHGRFPRRPPK